MLTFHLITDTHYYDLEALGFSDHKDQTVVNESGAVLNAVFDWLLAHDETDIVLIAGDLCTSSHRVNSENFVPMLRRLQAGGKRIFLIPASHDYYHADENKQRTDMVYRNELRDIYHEFGYDSAIASYEPDPLSYVVQLAPGYRLICLSTDGGKQQRELEDLLDWAQAQIREAKAEGQFIFGMHHYPVLPPSPVYPIVSGDIVDISARLAEAGLRFIFTGHTHMQNISRAETPAGGFYEINTGAAVGYDAPIRTVVIGETEMTITTSSIDTFDWDLQGKTVSQYLKDGFNRILNSIFEAMNNDVAEMLDIIDGEFRVNKAALLKHKLLLKLGGKFLYRLTLGGAGRLLLCKRKVPKSVRKVRVKDLFMEIVRNIYTGDEPYSVETPMGAAVFALAGRLEKLTRPFLKKADLPFESLQSFVMSLVYDDGLPDNNAVLPLED